MLNEGRIRPVTMDRDVAMTAPWVIRYGTIEVNRETNYGNALGFRPGDVAFLLAHEVRHIQQAQGQPWISRYFMKAFRFFFRGLGRAIEFDADRFACANAVNFVAYPGYLLQCPLN